MEAQDEGDEEEKEEEEKEDDQDQEEEGQVGNEVLQFHCSLVWRPKLSRVKITKVVTVSPVPVPPGMAVSILEVVLRSEELTPHQQLCYQYGFVAQR